MATVGTEPSDQLSLKILRDIDRLDYRLILTTLEMIGLSFTRGPVRGG